MRRYADTAVIKTMDRDSCGDGDGEIGLSMHSIETSLSISSQLSKLPATCSIVRRSIKSSPPASIAIHRGNAEGGIIPEEYQVEYVVDRVDTTATVWLD